MAKRHQSKPSGDGAANPHRPTCNRPTYYGQHDLKRMSPAKVLQLLQELQMYQLELDAQNEELRKTQEELIEARDRYTELYDFAPVGYLLLDAHGLITEANLAMAETVGISLTSLIDRRLSEFIVEEDRDAYYSIQNAMKKILAPRTCELRFETASGAPRWTRLQCVPEKNHEAGRFDPASTGRLRVIVSDIHQFKLAQIELRRHREHLEELVSERRTSMKPIVILLVEDDPDDAELTQLALQTQGITEKIVVARDGAEALEYFDVDADSVPDDDEIETIMLLDVNLPRIDGFEVCRRVRKTQTERPPYIIMLTAKGEKADMVRGLEVGADDYLSKPFDSGELGARIGVGRRILALQDRMAEKVRKLQEALDDINAMGRGVSSVGPPDNSRAE